MLLLRKQLQQPLRNFKYQEGDQKFRSNQKMQTMASRTVPTNRVVRVSSSYFFFSFLIHAFFSNATDPEIGSESTSSTPDSDDEKPETAFPFDRTSTEERNMPFDESSHGTRDTLPPFRWAHPSQPRRWSEEELCSISSAPPENPAHSVGRVVLYSHWESGIRGNESTAKGLYDLSVRKQRSEVSKWKKAVSDGKRPNGRQPQEPPSFESLPQSLKDHYEERSLKDVPWGYYKIHTCSTADQAQPRSASSLAQTVQDSAHRVTMYETHYQSFNRAEDFLQAGASGDKFAVLFDRSVQHSVQPGTCFCLLAQPSRC